ncbi:AraC family transcriptional regulator [Thaumasiovibrio sp. DFM-14]|uniref:AraC family transcriptional regulator n=1 Tax=Thaumasiovibrio sp. DFM-14 TaxID=3384792 RepID=UPI0039A05563
MINKDIPAVSLDFSSHSLELKVNKISRFYKQREALYIGKAHRLRFNALVYITAGEGYHFIDYKRYSIKAGTLLTLGRHQVHHFAEHSSVEGYVISFNNAFLQSRGGDPFEDLIASALQEVNCISDTDDILRSLFEQVSQEYKNKQNRYREEIIRHLMRVIMLKQVVPYYEALRHDDSSQSYNSGYYALKSQIEQVFTERPPVSAVANMMGKSAKQLDKIAKDYSGKSVKELLDDRVLLEAKRLLAFSQHSIAEISLQLGFKEATNMTKFFKRHTDLTPKDFRELCRSNVSKRAI